MPRESQFQRKLIAELKELFPGCVILKNDPNYIQGFPDLTILYKKHWAVLESKRSEKAHHQPNQDKYVADLGEMSYSSFVYPENKEQVIHELQQAFGTRRKARLPKRE